MQFLSGKWPIFSTILLFSSLHSVSIKKSFGTRKDLPSNANISKNHYPIPFGTMFESTKRNINFLCSQALWYGWNLQTLNYTLVPKAYALKSVKLVFRVLKSKIQWKKSSWSADSLALDGLFDYETFTNNIFYAQKAWKK